MTSTLHLKLRHVGHQKVGQRLILYLNFSGDLLANKWISLHSLCHFPFPQRKLQFFRSFNNDQSSFILAAGAPDPLRTPLTSLPHYIRWASWEGSFRNLCFPTLQTELASPGDLSILSHSPCMDFSQAIITQLLELRLEFPLQRQWLVSGSDA